MSPGDRQFSCIILAGGEGKRVGGEDKGLIDFRDKPLIRHVIDAIEDQVDDIVISANRNTEQYEKFGYTVITDPYERYRGPMAGIESCLAHCEYDQVLVVACDMPHLPDDLVVRLSSSKNSHTISIAEVDGRWQLAFIVDTKLSDSLTQSLQNDQLQLMRWIRQHNPAIVRFTETSSFNNFNVMPEST